MAIVREIKEVWILGKSGKMTIVREHKEVRLLGKVGK